MTGRLPHATAGRRRGLRANALAALVMLLFVLALDMGLGTSGSAAGAARRQQKSICKRYTCRTIDQTRNVRVFHAFKLSRYGGEALYSGTFAQWRGRQPTPLGNQFAYVLIRYGKYNGEGFSSTIDRMDVRAGRIEEARGSRIGSEKGPTLTTPCDGGLEQGSPGVPDLTVSADGAVAWINRCIA
jgi:hypothetical protein